MSYDYSGVRSTAERLIAKFGQPATLITMTATGGDPWNPVTSESETPVTVAVFDFKNSDVDGTLIQQNDKRVYLSTNGLSAVPETGNKLEVGGVRHEIISVSPLAPGGVDVRYELQVRR